jgi:hypothetical protein
MIDLKNFSLQIKKRLKNEDSDFESKLIDFLVANNWFEKKPVSNDGRVMVDPNDFEPYINRIDLYITNYKLSIKSKINHLYSMLSEKHSDTASKFKTFSDEFELNSKTVYYLLDFLLYRLDSDVCSMKDDTIQELLQFAFEDLNKVYGDTLTQFLRWLKEKFKTGFVNDYFMTKRSSTDNGSYDEEQYLHLLYLLFNRDYISENNMYVRAVKDKNYIDTWLFLSLHFLCALRNTDLIRIPHPRLTMTPQEVISKIETGEFADEDAKLTLYSITWRLTALQLIPNKTKRATGVSSIKFFIPESVQVHIGTLFAIAEAHRVLARMSDESPLIRVVKDHKRIHRYMGKEIGDFFLESDFSSRAANKSYLQTINMLTDDILENDDEFNVKGYILAALARSHKGNYGEFARTTAVYLKDAKLSKFTPEFVARELFERGVLSFIASMMLKIITQGEYDKLPVNKQTKLLKQLQLSPGEVEGIITLSEKSKERAIRTVSSIMKQGIRREELLNCLHKIGNGNAVSKMDECLCLATAMKKTCPYPYKTNCISCEYEISTSSTLFWMISEFNRLNNLQMNSKDKKLKDKYIAIIKSTVLPSMDEMLQCVKEEYGEEAYETLVKMVEVNSRA